MTVALCRTKSFGRFCRSVEMTTQRPVIGSFLSSGIERVLNHLDIRRAALELNRHAAEAPRALRKMMSHEVLARQPRHPQLLQRRHGFGRLAEPTPRPRLHFDEHERAPIAGDDVQ